MEYTRADIEQWLKEESSHRYPREWIVFLCSEALKASAPEARSSDETVELAREMDLTLGGHPAYKLTISSRRVHEIAKEVLRLNGKEPWDGSVRMNLGGDSDGAA